MQPVILNIYGLKCEKASCRFSKRDVKFEDFPKWIDKPCPKCGTNLLTAQEYLRAKMTKEYVELLSETVAPILETKENLHALSVSFNGRGILKESKIIKI